MKMTKRIMAVLLAVFLLAALAVVPASAAANITINNAEEGATYNAYKLFDVVYAGGKPLYTVENTSAWYQFAVDNNFELIQKEGNTYYVLPGTAADVAATALTYVTTAGNIDPTASVPTNASGDTVISLADGYYVMKSDKGANPFAFTVANGSILIGGSGYYTANTINEKNMPGDLPTIEKEGTPEGPVTKGSTITYTITVETEEGSSPVIHDKMTGLDSFSLTSITLNGVAVPAANYNLFVAPNAEITDGCSFHMTFNNIDFKAYDKIVVTYTAKVTEEGIVTGVIKNEAWLEELGIGGGDEEPTYVYEFTLKKTGSDTGSAVLNGAKFTLDGIDLAAVDTAGNVIATDGDLTNLAYYRPAAAEEAVQTYIIAGEVVIKGLAAGTYTLVETMAPAGYIKAADTTIVIEEQKDGEGNPTGGYTMSANGGGSAAGTVVTVNNTAGTELPSTGGVGTTIFYVAGLVLVLAAVTVLVSKKRANA